MQPGRAKTEKTQDSPLHSLAGGAPRPAGGQFGLQAAIRVHSSHHERVCTLSTYSAPLQGLSWQSLRRATE